MLKNAVHKTSKLADVIRFLRHSDGFKSAKTYSYAPPSYRLPSYYTSSMSSHNASPGPISISASSSLTTNSERIARLTDQQLDIWEHAALLYHSYEWQSAADSFVRLVREIKHDEERTICMLNAGLIEARLGDSETAALRFEAAAATDECNPIACFLLSVLCHELRDYSKAETCLEMCLDDLDGGPINHNDAGLSFILDRELVCDNLKAARMAQYSVGSDKSVEGSIAHVASVPAECIFEAPQRTDTSQIIEEQEVKPMSKHKEMWYNKFGVPIQEPSTSERRLKRSVTFPNRKQKHLSSLSREYLPQEQLSSGLEDSDPASSSLRSLPQEIMASSPPTTGSSYGSSDKRLTWHNRPRTPYTPRDARGEYGDTRDLQKVVRKGPPPKALKMVPRDPRGEYEPIEEVANFATHYAPDNRRDSIPEPLILDHKKIADARQAHMLKLHYDSPMTSPVRDTPVSDVVSDISDAPLGGRQLVFSGHSGPGSNHAHQRQFNETRSGALVQSDHAASLRRDSEPWRFPTTESEPEPELELLGPTAYRPPLEKEDRDPGLYVPPLEHVDNIPAVYVPPPLHKNRRPEVYEARPKYNNGVPVVDIFGLEHNDNEPAIYTPPRSDWANKLPIPIPDRIVTPPPLVAQIFEPPGSPFSTGSSLASDTRRERERDVALANLEGRQPPPPAQSSRQVKEPAKPVQSTRQVEKPTEPAKRPRPPAKPATNKPLPPKPDAARDLSPPQADSRVNSVATENFFDKVLGTETQRGRR